MALTGQQLLQGLSEFMGDWYSSATTSADATGLTIVDTGLQAFGQDELNDGWVRVTQAGANANAVRRASDFGASTLTVAPAFSAIGLGDTYEFHRFDPRLKFKALDRARTVAYPQLAIIRLIETLTGDGENTEISIPSTLRKGPVEVWEQAMLSPSEGWNALGDPYFNSLSSKWTAGGSAVASLQARHDSDLLVPAFEQNCVKLVGSGTYSQVIADQRWNAAQTAGRRVTFAVRVFQRATTGTATISITHSGTTVTSSVHGGAGWQYLTVTATLPSANSVLTCTITTGGSVTIYVEHGFLIGADRLPLKFPTRLSQRGIVRDDTTQTLRLIRPARRGYQLRWVGRDVLSALGTTVASQPTNSMEVDEHSARLLYAKAARLLLMERGWTTARIEEVHPYIGETEAQFHSLADDWAYELPHEQKLDGWWSLA